MQVKVIHRLSPQASDIEDELVSFEMLLRGNALGGVDDRRDDVAVVGAEVRDGFDVLLRDDDDVDRGFGMDIGKSHDLLILGDHGCRYLARNDAAEYALHVSV